MVGIFRGYRERESLWLVKPWHLKRTTHLILYSTEASSDRRIFRTTSHRDLLIVCLSPTAFGNVQCRLRRSTEDPCGAPKWQVVKMIDRGRPMSHALSGRDLCGQKVVIGQEVHQKQFFRRNMGRTARPIQKLSHHDLCKHRDRHVLLVLPLHPTALLSIRQNVHERGGHAPVRDATAASAEAIVLK